MKERPCGGAPYKFSKEGVGALSSVTTKEHPCHVYSDSMALKQIIGQTITYSEAPAASKSSPDGTQHSEWHHIM